MQKTLFFIPILCILIAQCAPVSGDIARKWRATGAKSIETGAEDAIKKTEAGGIVWDFTDGFVSGGFSIRGRTVDGTGEPFNFQGSIKVEEALNNSTMVYKNEVSTEKLRIEFKIADVDSGVPVELESVYVHKLDAKSMEAGIVVDNKNILVTFSAN